MYVEKPLSLRVAEGRAMAAVDTMVACARWASTVDRSISAAKPPNSCAPAASARSPSARLPVQNEWPKGISNPPDGGPPADFDWDAWLGPAPKVPYNKNRTFYRFRWFYDYSGGQVTNFWRPLYRLYPVGARSIRPDARDRAGRAFRRHG